MARTLWRPVRFALVTLAVSTHALSAQKEGSRPDAQDPAGTAPAVGAPAASAPAASAPMASGPRVPWETGPLLGTLGAFSQVKVNDGCGFTGSAGTKTFLELTENPTNGSEQGTVICEIVIAADTSEWFAIFEFDESGYVKDDEKGSLDADAMLKSLKAGNEAGNKYRREQGWEEIDLVGWERAPYYDPATNNLTWATRVRSTSGGESINHSVRLLGRSGVMSVDLVVSPEGYAPALPGFTEMVNTHEFNSGLKYSEWREGDKVAAYGLTALVAGGAGALALKSGLFGKLWKVLAAAGVALAAGFKKLFGKKEGATS